MAKRKPKVDAEIDPLLIADQYPTIWIETNLYNPDTLDSNGDPLPVKLRDYQRLIMDDEHTHRVLSLGRQVGKCESENTTIQLADGSKPTAREIFETVGEMGSFNIVSMNQHTFRLEKAIATISDNGVKDAIRIETDLGFETTNTDNHPYLVWRDTDETPRWIDAKDLEIGDKIAACRQIDLSEITRNEVPEPSALLLGLLIGDGGCSQNSYSFTTADDELLQVVSKTIDELHLNSELVNRGTNPYNYGFRRRDQSDSDTPTIRDFGKKYGLDKKLSINKTIPESLFRSTNRSIAAFLSGYIATDGWVSKRVDGKYEVGICSASKKLIFQTRTLFLRLGIRSLLRHKLVKYKTGYKDAWTLTILESSQIVRLASQIKIPLTRKQESLNIAVSIAEGVVQNNNRDTIPIGVWNLVDRLLQERKWSYRKMLGGTTYDNRRIRKNYCPQRSKLLNQTLTLEDKFLQNMCTSDIQWVTVSKIEYVGKVQTYAISVPGNETLITDDLITHNSMMLSLDAIMRTTTNPNTIAVIITPFKAQARKLFDDIQKFIDASPFVDCIDSKMSPTMVFNLSNKSKIQLFTAAVSAGGKADQIRGFKANYLYLDEADYIPDEAMAAVMMVTASIANPRVWVSSTPTGRKGYFYKVFNDPIYKAFHFSSWVNPNWDEKKDLAAKLQLSQIGYEHEVLAEFSSNEQGVFLKQYIEHAFEGHEQKYSYSQLNSEDYTFKYVGVDWNEANNGVQIATIGIRMPTEPGQLAKVALIEKVEVRELDYTQTIAIEKILELNRRHNPAMIYVDKGFGSMQVEIMHRMGYIDPSTGFDKKLKAIDFGESTEIFDPIVGKMIKKRNKGLMVDNLARIFERKMIVLPQEEKGENLLEYALINYSIVRVSPNGTPVYECVNCPDHFLMAFMLAINAFYLHQGAFADPSKIFSGSVPIVITDPIVTKISNRAMARDLQVRGLQRRANLFPQDGGKFLADLDLDPGDPTPSRRLEYFKPGQRGSILNHNTVRTQRRSRAIL